MSSAIERSNGFLPLVPLRHAEPTAVGVWDVDAAYAATPPLELPSQGSRDQVVLARLHGQPLAILHLNQPPGATTRAALIVALWQQASDAIVEHVTACRCLPAPEDAAELRMMLDADAAGCAGRAPRRPVGKAVVILCTTGAQQETLSRSLGSLTEMDAENFEVVVVDNCPSRPETRATVESFVSPVCVRYVAEPQPGLSVARNAGVAAAADAAFLAFTDDDVVVDRSWLAWLVSPFTEATVQTVTGLVMPLSLGSVAEKRFEHYAGFGKGVARATYDLGPHAAGDRFLYPYWGGMFGSGNSMAFRREALLAVGGFDPALGAGTPTGGGEDLAAFTDVILAGGQVVYEPRSLCWHEHRGDEQALRAQVRNYGIGLTALLCRYLMTDWRFSATALRSLPAITRLAKHRSEDRELDRLPADLARLELRGRMLGPWRYVVSRRSARAAGNDDAAHQVSGRRRREQSVDQAGAQTRT
jgi:glycosyltransferase involved in cell wall biosynthesis